MDGAYDKKRGSTRHDRIPVAIRQEVIIDQVEDYVQFVPYELSGQFTSKEFAKAAGIHIDTARQVLQILNDVKAVKRVGKQSRSYLYEVGDLA